MGETHKINIETDIISEVLIESEELKVLLFESVRELLFNVIKHARSSWARIKMVHEEAGILRITVSDEGVGFDSDEIVKNLGRGDRFGLFSIRERLELIGGSLEINSSPGHGAEFNLIVPLDKATTKEPLDPGEISFEETRAASLGAGRQIRVLLVDDHVVMRQGLLSLLDGHSDIKVVGEAGDGEEAVRMARELQPEVILMDINMPEMDGMKATRLIHSELPHIRIIGLSMYDGAETEEGMLNAGAAAFVSKSGRTDSLLAVIRGRSPKTAGQRLEVAL
jgi:CheY-like chemotaxis protein